jgi:hypothetical protein
MIIMGMSIEDNETTVAKIIANDSKSVRPLAIKVKDFNNRGLTENEVEVSLSRLVKIGVVEEYRERWGFFTKEEKGQGYTAFEETGTEPQFSDDDGLAGKEEKVYCIEFSTAQLSKYLESKRGAVVTSRVIEKRGEDFYCNNKKIAFESNNSQYYFILDILYGDDGGSKLVGYKTIDKELVARGEDSLDDAQKVLQRIRNAVNNGLYFRVDKNLKKYVKIKSREGVEFINPSR